MKCSKVSKNVIKVIIIEEFLLLKKTRDSILINTTNLTKRSCFLKIKQIMDKKLKL